MSKLDIKMVLARTSKLLGTVNGLDACLMLAQYSSPFIIALLLRLSRLRSALPSAGGKLTSGSALRTAEGIKNVAGAVGDARAVMRAFGLVPVVLALIKLHPRPVQALKSFRGDLTSPKAIPTIQTLSLIGFYAMDHITWLTGKGVLRVDPLRVRQLGLWGTRCWALYVLLELYNLNQTYSALRTRTRAARIAKPYVSPLEAEGYEVPVAESSAGGSMENSSPDSTKHLDRDRLRKDWDAWRLAALTNWSFAPLTLHWSVDGGIWSNPVITYTLGTAAALGRVASSWSVTEA